MVGGQATDQGDCSKFKSALPHCCRKDPTIVDLLPGTPYNMQIANCCKGGVLNSWAQDPDNHAASFQVSVGNTGNTNKTIRVPRNITLMTPGPGYTCGAAKIVRPTKFTTPDGKRTTQAMSKINIFLSLRRSGFPVESSCSCCSDVEYHVYILPASGAEVPYMLRFSLILLQ